MRPLQLSPQQQKEFSEKLNAELEKMIMSWDNNLREWHPIAIKALKFTSVRVLQIPQRKFKELFFTEPQGINMNVVMYLSNNIEDRTAFEMGYEPEIWAEKLLLNDEIALRWHALAMPIQQKLYREFEIMNNKAHIPMKVIKAEA